MRTLRPLRMALDHPVETEVPVMVTMTAHLHGHPIAETIDDVTYWWIWIYNTADETPTQVLCPPGWEPDTSGPSVTVPGRMMRVEGRWVRRKAPPSRPEDQSRFIKASKVEAIQYGHRTYR